MGDLEAADGAELQRTRAYVIHEGSTMYPFITKCHRPNATPLQRDTTNMEI